ncbi:MAG: Gfo/Idh/MocA family oxidoreductase [Provencibacterium sp.]|jgi:scyllo-inositol 2-dehydrogenase (NADP+)|nr:Gfo/Idh/MocA family oxidoreductase [Provencibacterium sp.]
MKKFRVAIIGYGRSGRNIHKHLLEQLPEKYEIVAIADADAQRREMIQAETKAEALENHAQLYGRTDIDFVVNASFSMDHAPISKELLEHGFNVLSEKPAASSPAEFEAGVKAAEEHGCFYHVFQQYRFAPSYLKLKEVIASGVLGRIVQVSLNYSGFARRWDWQTIQRFKAGSLLNTGPHPVDQALDLMGFPKEVQVTAAFDRAHTYGDAEDYVKVLLQAENAPVLDIEITSTNAFSDYTYLVQGTLGSLKGTTKKLEWKYYVEADEPEQKLTDKPLRDEKGEPIYCREKLTLHTGDWEAAGDEVDDFNYKGLQFYNRLYETLANGAPFPITHAQVSSQMAVMEEAHRQNDARISPFVK